METANPAFLRQFEVSEEETTGTLVYDLGNGQWDIPELHRDLPERFAKTPRFNGISVERAFTILAKP
ncbi:MAG TPA: hypothetical protein VMM55_01465 [Thermohalobaculum sp.]|nr:hypothetical protein [Thermohalobaculum sp.]